MYVLETIPLAEASPTGLNTSDLDADTLLIRCSGFHLPIFATVPIACAVGLGVAMSRNVSAPDRAGLATCGDPVGAGPFWPCLAEIFPVGPPMRFWNALRKFLPNSSFW